MQDPLWVGIEQELLRGGGGLLAFGVPIPPRAWSDDWIMALPSDAPIQQITTVFGAICVDLGISCKPEALRAFLRQPPPHGQTPALQAWDPFRGGVMYASFSLLGDRCPTRQLGVPRAPGSGPQPYREVVMRRLDLGLASLSNFRLSWEEP